MPSSFNFFLQFHWIFFFAFLLHRIFSLVILLSYFCYSCQHYNFYHYFFHILIFLSFSFILILLFYLLAASKLTLFFYFFYSLIYVLWFSFSLVYNLIILHLISNFLFYFRILSINFLFTISYYYNSFHGEPAIFKFAGISLLIIIVFRICNIHDLILGLLPHNNFSFDFGSKGNLLISFNLLTHYAIGTLSNLFLVLFTVILSLFSTFPFGTLHFIFGLFLCFHLNSN